MGVKANVVIINPDDNVAVALADIKKGEAIHLPDDSEFAAQNDIPFSHKIALREISCGEEIIKYGEVIGKAGEEIKKGELVHTHNLVVWD
jgi:altronate dehydratase